MFCTENALCKCFDDDDDDDDDDDTTTNNKNKVDKVIPTVYLSIRILDILCV